MESVEKPLEESYYKILSVPVHSSIDEIRRAYRKLAMQWHPDRLARNPRLIGEAKRRFQKIQEAYEVLSDPHKRAMYDAGLYDPNDEYDEGYCDFMEEMLSLMGQVQEKDKACSMEELQSMFMELVQSFESAEMKPPAPSNLSCSSTMKLEPDAFAERSTVAMPWG